MIAKGNPHNDGPYLARYLAADSKGNERAELAELRGFASDNIYFRFFEKKDPQEIARRQTEEVVRFIREILVSPQDR